MTTVHLAHRHYGAHSPVKNVEIDCEPSELVTKRDVEGPERVKYYVDEAKLLDLLPEGFLPEKPSKILLMVGFEWGGHAAETTIFRSWGKYFDAYSLNIQTDGKDLAEHGCLGCGDDSRVCGCAE